MKTVINLDAPQRSVPNPKDILQYVHLMAPLAIVLTKLEKMLVRNVNRRRYVLRRKPEDVVSRISLKPFCEHLSPAPLFIGGEPKNNKTVTN